MAARSILQHTGIPPSWLEKRPKIPSRNWLIFLSVTSSVVGLYLYDRQQCKHIRQYYVDKVKHLAEEPMNPFEFPRKVSVYAAKWPGDEDYDQSMRYFRKYVKVCKFSLLIYFKKKKTKIYTSTAYSSSRSYRL